MRKGTTAPFHRPTPLTAATLEWEHEENPSGKPEGVSKPSHQVYVLSPGACTLPTLILFYFPSTELCFMVAFLRPPSQTTIPLRGALALPPPRFVASFSVYCGLGFISQRAYLLIFHTGQSNTLCTCGDLHLQDPRGSLPSLMKQERGLGDRKMHDGFKLLLLSPSRTQGKASTKKAFLLFVSYGKKKDVVFPTDIISLVKILSLQLVHKEITASHSGML